MNLELSRSGRFRSGATIQSARDCDSYRLLPFKFERLPDGNRCVVTNDAGEYCIVNDETISHLAAGSPVASDDFKKLERIHVVAQHSDGAPYSLLPLKIRRKHERLGQFTSLHMMVVTLRCNQSCPYCQVSRQSEDRAKFDMSFDTARRALEHIFASPSRAIKIEFQGGESLLNFELIRQIVEEAKTYSSLGKDVAFVAATNLTFLNKEIIKFFGDNDILFSTSIDGPDDLHNANRPYKGKDAFEQVCKNIRLIQRELGTGKVSALMTTTARSLGRVEEIVDQYIELGFRSIFLRSLSPYGFALKTKSYYEYSAKEWLEFYKEGLDYILEVNRNGYFLQEFYTFLLAQKMLRGSSTSYVDLQSPTGVGIMGAVYDYDGNIYASDEGRMLAQMGDASLRLGTVEDSYLSLFGSGLLPDLVVNTMAQSVPMCSDCGFQPWCGSDPSYHQSTQKDFVGHKAFSGFCHKQMGAFRHLLNLFEDRPEDKKIIETWIDR